MGTALVLEAAPGLKAPPRVPSGVRVYAVGDIHGRADVFDRAFHAH